MGWSPTCVRVAAGRVQLFCKRRHLIFTYLCLLLVGLVRGKAKAGGRVRGLRYQFDCTVWPGEEHNLLMYRRVIARELRLPLCCTGRPAMLGNE